MKTILIFLTTIFICLCIFGYNIIHNKPHYTHVSSSIPTELEYMKALQSYQRCEEAHPLECGSGPPITYVFSKE